MKHTSGVQAVPRKELCQLLDHYRTLVEHSPDVVVRISAEGTIKWISPTVRSLLGWEPGEVEGLRPVDLTHPDDLSMALQAQLDLLSGKCVDVELRMRTPSGGYAWVMARAKPLVVEGVVRGRVAHWHDVTAEHEVLEAHRAQERRFRDMIDRAADLVLHTTGGVITWVSAAVERTTGWSPDDMRGSPSSRWVHPDDHDAMAALRLQRTTDRPGRARCRVHCRDGSFRWFDLTSVLIDESGDRWSAVSVLRDIDDQVRAERERDHLEQRLHITVESMFEPHVHLSPVVDAARSVVDLVVLSANPAACVYVRRTAAELVGMRVSELVPARLDRGLVARAHEVMHTGVPHVDDEVRSWSDAHGEHRRYDIRLIRVDRVLALTFRDVTERYERFVAEARIRAMEALGEERERLARDLHDGAIQKVFATSMRLAALASVVPPHQRERVEELIDLQDAVIRDLRTTVYDLGTTGRRSGSPRKSVHDTVQEAGRALGFAPLLEIHDDVTELDEDTLGHLLLVLREALSNVARHAHARRVEVDLALCGSEVVLSVWDDGVGLPDHLMHGNGLGNMVRRAQLLGGVCEVDSAPSGGTAVVWRVPVVASCAHHG